MPTPLTALITGAASGIGLATSELLLKDGHKVIMADRNAEVSAIAAALAERSRGQAVAMVVDLGQEANVLQLCSDILRQFAGVDILVNNAGIHPKKNGNKVFLEETTSEIWATVMAINLTAPFLLCRELMTAMKARDGAVSSTSRRIPRAPWCRPTLSSRRWA